ncbi:MAG: ferredoxin oxidoreductase [Clostridiales bacterium]|nr:ferredoxin oxidoreductase [Clostridiales bacterium]
MSLNITRINPHFEDVMPNEYKELVSNGPFGGGKSIGDLGTFKELLEEHPLCAGCNLALAFRLLMASLPTPEDTVVVGTTGCNSLAFTQLALHNVHSLFGNQNAVASGLKRALEIRFPDTTKDVVVIAGDGGTVDIGLDMTLHSWFRREKISTVMFDNELYANTGGQESGMSLEGAVLNMAPLGKKFEKVRMADLAIGSGCDYVAVVSAARPRQIGKSFEKAVLIAREVGPTFVQIHTPCPTNMKLKAHEGILAAKERLKTDYAFREHISPAAEEYLASLEAQSKPSACGEVAR